MARTTTTALLRSRRQTQQSINDWEDQLLDYEWNQSAKTIEDFNSYRAHYNGRIELSSGDPKSQLSYQKKIDSGFRGYTSNEIQRTSIAIIEGNADETTKLNKLTDLYTQAYAVGNYDLAQSLRLQLDNQIVKIQNEQIAAMSGGGGGYGGSNNTALKNQIKATISDYKAGVLPIDLGNGQTITMETISSLIKTKGEDAIADMAASSGFKGAQGGLEMIRGIMGSQIGQLQEQLAGITDPAVRAELEGQINSLKDLKIDIAGSESGSGRYTISYNDIEQEIRRRANGNPSFTFAPDGAGGFKKIDYSIQDIATGNNQMRVDEDGNVYFEPMFGSSSQAEFDRGYENKEKMVYQMKDGKIQAINKSELPSWMQKATNKVLGGEYMSYDQVLHMAGLRDVGDAYEVAEGMRQIMKDSGFDIDASGLIAKSAFNLDRETGLPETISADGTKVLTYELQGDKLVPLVKVAVTPDQYLRNQGYDASARESTAVDSLGNVKYKDLQPAAGAALIQAQRGARMIQNAGGSMGVLQKAASAQQINRINAAEIEQIRVKEVARQQEALRVARAQEQQRRLAVINQQQVVPNFGVRAPVSQPILRGVTNAPSSRMTSSGGARALQGTYRVQGQGYNFASTINNMGSSGVLRVR